ncbi:MAG: 4'-phosphopantetheinyl transferase superfamily protein [Bauldia sp.]|nr:4'-phosphopantetheinyl transferase superfamily protein [Bauldia sp.]
MAALRWSVRSTMEPGAIVEVFVVHSDNLVEEADALLPALSPAEAERAARYRRSEDRSRFIIGRGLLRRLLGDRLAVAPRSLPIEAGPFGKPALAGGPGFNVSHSGRWIAIAIGDREVGIDIEERIALDPLPLAALSPEEQARVRRAADPLDAFLSIWVAKEAVLKADGRGLGGGTTPFTVPPDRMGRPHLVRTEGGRVAGIGVATLDLPPGVHGAVAARGDAWTLDTFLGTADECLAHGRRAVRGRARSDLCLEVF